MYLDQINKYYCTKMKIEIQDLMNKKNQIDFKEAIGKKIKNIEKGYKNIYIFFTDNTYSIISAENDYDEELYLITFQNIYETSNIQEALNMLIKNNITSLTAIDNIIKKYINKNEKKKEEYEKELLKRLKEKYEKEI
jgi:hypothetical protein